ncbi:MAG: prenyltransferase/squalene oxidase repeat-containing protein [Actinomycetota bacterium]
MSTVRPITRIAGQVLSDLARRSPGDAGADRQTRIDAALTWLCLAQDVGTDRGFSYGYTIRGGWQPSYVETTGYIICTFLAAAARLERPALAERATDAGDWLLTAQLADGSFPNPGVSETSGLVFDTGQDLFGLLALAGNADGDRFDAAARRAADWLIEVADDEGRWTRSTYNGIPHVYNSRVAWALVRAGLRFDDSAAFDVARANLDWACEQQLDNGWFENCAFTPEAPPFTHTTAYAGRGLLEAGLLLGEDRYLDAARSVAEAAGRHLGADGRLPGRISVGDTAESSSSCLTGNAQYAIIWLKLAQLDDEKLFRRWGLSAVDAVGRQQALDGPPEMRGAIKGSDPVWGRYAPLGYPNWATKFFVDALLEAERVTS